MDPESPLPCSQEQIVCHFYPLHTLSSYFFNIFINITLKSKPRSSKWCLSFRFSNKMLCAFSSTDNLAHFDLITLILFGEVYKLVKHLLIKFIHYSVTSSALGLNILLSTLFSNIFNLYSSLVRGWETTIYTDI